jgi:N-acetylglucosamine-6-sulfatase
LFQTFQKAARAPLLAVAALAAVGLLGLGRCASGEIRNLTSPPRPNVLIIISDDMRFDELWAMPTVSALARRGVTFSRFYTPTPLCCPSRASFMSGLYARHHGVLANNPPQGGFPAFDDRSTLATWLQASGVRTGLIGRYLNSYESLYIPPGWDQFFAIWQATEGHGNYFSYRVNDNGERRYFAARPEDYSTRVIAQQALRFLEADRDRPFMLMLTPRTPHGPATPDPIDSGIYKDLDIALPPSYDEEDVSDKPSMVRDLPPLSDAQRKELDIFRRHQLEALVGLDRAISGLVEALRADGRLDRTWIFYTTDNGLKIGEHRRDVGKSCPYEECARVPLVVVPPGGTEPPRTDEHLVANIDIAPTIAAIIGTKPDGAVDGSNLLPLVQDTATPWRDALTLEMLKDEDVESGTRYTAVRTADRKYVRYPDGEEELYDEAADPYELQNQANNPTWADEKQRLAARLDALLNDDSVPTIRKRPTAPDAAGVPAQ